MKKFYIALLWLSCGCVVTNAQNYVKTTTFNTTNMVDLEYYDGLGYPEQTVQVAASPQFGSIITPYWHDSQGREDARIYLPYSSSNSGYATDPIAEQEAYYRGIYGNGETRNFVEKIYESSPLNRPLIKQMPGSVFESANKKTVYEYAINQGGGVLLLKYDENSENISINGCHASNALFCTKITDEDGAQKSIYYNMQQQKVLERSDADIDTYYVYNNRGLLCWVIQPEGSTLLPSSGSVSSDSDIAKKFCFRYYYDGRGRMVERQMPGREIEYMVYDRSDRLVMLQDGNLRAKGQWRLDKLDDFGRPIHQGFTNSLETRDALQALFDNRQDAPLYSIHSMGTFIYNSYDRAQDLDYPFIEIPGIVSQGDLDTRTKGLPTHTKIRILAKPGVPTSYDGYIEKYFYYDYRGRIIQTVTRNHLDGISRISCRYDHVGNVLACHETHQNGFEAVPDVLLTKYTYDPRGRLLTQKTTLDGSLVSANVYYTYDDLGKLIERNTAIRHIISRSITATTCRVGKPRVIIRV